MTDNRKIAITGGIGVGKSYVCSLLKIRGIHVYDCDAAAKRLIAQNKGLQAKLNILLGKNVFVNGIAVCKETNQATCGHPASGSINVFVG